MSDIQLHQAYFDILKDVNPDFFDKKSINNLNYSGFSGLFVSSTPDIWEAGKRVMVIGRETRGGKLLITIIPIFLSMIIFYVQCKCRKIF